jgi:hypothetical protein
MPLQFSANLSFLFRQHDSLSRNSPGRPKSFLPLEGRTERSEGFRGGLNGFGWQEPYR